MPYPSLADLSKRIPFLTSVPKQFEIPRFGDELITSKNQVIKFIQSLQMPDGGFAKKPAEKHSLTWATGQVLGILAQVQELGVINQDALLQWIPKRQLQTGGFEWKEGIGKATMENTAYGIISMLILDKLDLIDLQQSRKFILGRQKDGGFCKENTSSQPSVWSTYNAILALKAMDELDKIDLDQVARYLGSCQKPNGGFEKFQSKGDITVYTTGYAITTAAIIDRLNLIDIESGINFIKKHQFLSGGFPYRLNETESQTWATGHVIMGLSAVKRLDLLDWQKTIELLLSRQLTNGGFVFRGNRSLTDTNISPSFNAVVSIYKLIDYIARPARPDIDELPLILLKDISGKKRVDINDLSEQYSISPFLAQKLMENIMNRGWVQGKLTKNKLVIQKTASIQSITNEQTNLEDEKTSFSELLSNIEFELSDLKTKLHREITPELASEIHKDLKKIEKHIKEVDNNLSSGVKNYQYVDYRVFMRESINEWDSKKRDFLLDIEKIRFSTEWRTRKELKNLKKHKPLNDEPKESD